ncbi:MAG TPA: 30S ribosomal protein S12 methylthiotransferase RimO [bacterium]|nr:30S ribosomal protein S12 methylthiotransferase RimO [bacterium]
MKKQTICMITLGCAKNLVDSEHVLASLAKEGYQYYPNPRRADIIIVNTCAFIESAQKEAVNTILRSALYKRTGNCRHLIVIGCLAQRYARDIVLHIPEVDAVLGTGTLGQLPEVIQQLDSATDTIVRVDAPGGVLEGERLLSTSIGTAYLKLAEGCQHRCTFCIIPELRGPLVSRSESSIVEEARILMDHGVQELILIAQDSSSYGLDLYGELRLPQLLKKLVRLNGFKWIRLLYLYPQHVTDELLQVMAEEGKICPYLDLPIQHISDSILKAMGRGSNKETLLRLLDKIRVLLPDVALRTTFIIGFPGETEKDFLQVLNFMQQEKFDWAGAFTFSPQYNTPAAMLPNQIPEHVKQERLHRLRRLQRQISSERNKVWLGRVLPVLIEQTYESGGTGRCFRQAPDVDGVTYVRGKNLEPGQFRQVVIEQTTTYDLKGRIANEST